MSSKLMSKIRMTALCIALAVHWRHGSAWRNRRLAGRNRRNGIRFDRRGGCGMRQ